MSPGSAANRSSTKDGATCEEAKENNISRKGASAPQARWLYAVEEEWRPFDDCDNGALESKWSALVRNGKLPERRKEGNDKVDKKEDKPERAEAELNRSDKSGDSRKGKAEDSEDDDKGKPITTAVYDLLGEPGKKVSEAINSGDATPMLKDDDNDDEEQDNVINERLDPDASAEEREMRVEVMEDKLYDVDLEMMKLFPVFWKGVLLPVTRAHWFYSSSDGGYAPIPSYGDLSHDLDRAYAVVKPNEKFDDRGKDDRASEAKKDKSNTEDSQNFTKGNQKENEEDAEDVKDLKDDDLFELPSMPDNGAVHFKSASMGHIYTKDVKGRFMAAIGGNLIVRGWDVAARRAGQSRLSRLFDSSSLPWTNVSRQKEEEDAADLGKQDSYGAMRAQHHSGAAKAEKKPQSANTTSSSSSSNAKEEANTGVFGRLWPSSDALLRPDIALLRAFGWSKEDANAEGQRKAQQKNTEEGLREQDHRSGQEDGDEQGKNPISDECKDEPPELVLVIHGIGQKLTEDFDALDFVYDVERLRNLAKDLCNNVDLRRISKGKRVQFLPVCWRRELSFDEADPIRGNDNKYSLSDVSNDATIPMIRNIISKVVLDVPYYLSRHQSTMIDSVKNEVNRIYRLFCVRNADFERRGGRVNLICHSLGSSLAADILSNQPTLVPPLDQQDQSFRQSDAPLCFNVRNLFFVGSPNGFFLHLKGGQLIARKGTRRTQDCPDDVAVDKVGRYGCLAAESIYNCYNTTDPVAFQLGATIDRNYALMTRPIALAEAVPALLEALTLPRLSLSRFLEVVHPFSKAGDVAEMRTDGNDAVIEEDDGAQRRSGAARKAQHQGQDQGGEPKENPSQDRIFIEKGASQKKHQIREKAKVAQKKAQGDSSYTFEKLIRAEKRFRALNPHGCVDFTFESSGYNQYLDMLSAHVSYWTNKTFATFILTQLYTDFSSPEGKQHAPTVIPEVNLRRKEKAEEKEHGDDEQSSDTD